MNGRELKDLALLLRCLNWDTQYWAWLAVDTGEFKRFFITHPASPVTSVFLKWLDYPSHSHMGLQSKNNSLEIQMENYYSLWWPFKSNLLFQISLKFVSKKTKKKKAESEKNDFYQAWQWRCDNRSLMIKSSSCLKGKTSHFKDKVTKHTMTKGEKKSNLVSQA